MTIPDMSGVPGVASKPDFFPKKCLGNLSRLAPLAIFRGSRYSFMASVPNENSHPGLAIFCQVFVSGVSPEDSTRQVGSGV